MDLILQPSATRCAVTGAPFQAGDRVVSVLGRDGAGIICRWDLLLSAEEQFASPPAALCRWVHAFKPRDLDDNPERALKLTAENLFLTLCDPAAEIDSVNTPLLQFLALMLERKRLLRPKGLTADGAKRIYEHAKTKQLFEVPAGELTAEFFRKVQEQLGVLVGEPKKTAPVAPAAATPEEPASAPAPAVAPPTAG
jgi:hypothetical protein